MTDEHKPELRPFWLDEEGRDRTPEFNFYRFCQVVEKIAGSHLGATGSPQSDAIRFRPHPGMGFPAGELKATDTDPEYPERAPVVRANFLGLYGVDSPLPTAYLDDLTRDREGSDAVMAFLDIFNHRIMTQFYRIWRKYSYPATFEPGGTDSTSQSLMALGGIARAREHPTSRLLALLPAMLHPTHTADGLAAVIRTQAMYTQVTVVPHCPVMMPVDDRMQFSMDNDQLLGDNLILGDEVSDKNYCTAVELSTDDPTEARSWMPGGQLKADVFALLRVYLGSDYDVRFWLTLPTRLLPRPRLGNDDLLCGYNIMLGLDDESESEDLPETVRIDIGQIRGKDDIAYPPAFEMEYGEEVA